MGKFGTDVVVFDGYAVSTTLLCLVVEGGSNYKFLGKNPHVPLFFLSENDLKITLPPF